MSGAVQGIFADWTLPVWMTVSVVLTAVIYVRGWLAIRKTRKAQFTDVRLVSFLSGLVVLWLAGRRWMGLRMCCSRPTWSSICC
jgi:putative membrane protein